MDKIEVKNIFAAVFDKGSLDPLLDYFANSQFSSLKPGFEPRFWGTDGTVNYVKSKGFAGESVIRGFAYGGRVKSLDRSNFVRILADRSNPKHLEELQRELSSSSDSREVHNSFGHPELGSGSKIPKPFDETQGKQVRNDGGGVDWEPIDLVIVDLYAPDEKNFPESMDIGGQALIRAAIKNYQNVALAFDEESIGELVSELKVNDGSTTLAFRKAQAKKASKFIAERTRLEAELFEEVD